MNLPQLTLEDWKQWEGRWELIHGVAYDMPPAPGLEHQRISMQLSLEIANALRIGKKQSGGGDCEVFAAPIDLFLDANVFQPDLLVVCDPAKKKEGGIQGPPELVVEILSRRTSGKDLTTKRWSYEAAKIPEYLILDPEEKVGLLLRLDDQGRYQDAARLKWGDPVTLLEGRITLTLG